MDRTRASDSEREQIATILSEAAAAGRLTVEELEERTGRAYAAKTRGELDALIEDLPRPTRRPQSQLPHALPPMPSMKPQATPPPGYLPPLGPSESRWPGPRPWMPGDQRFWVRWRGPADTRTAGTHIMDHVVPVFRRAGYEIIERAADKLVLRRQVSELTAILGRGLGWEVDSITIQMFDRRNHTVTDIYGVAPQGVREALVLLAP